MHRKLAEGAGALSVTRGGIGSRRIRLGACMLRAAWVVMATVVLVGGLAHAEDRVPSDRQEQLVFVGPWPASDDEVQRLLRVYTEVFRRLGLGIRYREVPARRASDLAERGLADGELSRVYEYGNHFRNLVRVEEPHHEKVLRAYCLHGPELDGWESLKDVFARVECPRGVVACLDNVRRYVPAERIHENDTLEQGLQRLMRERVDVYIDVSERVEAFLQSRVATGHAAYAEIHAVGDMAVVKGYLWLHKRHAGLAWHVAETLREMKRSGEFQQLYGQ
ncbi:MAG: hypothetical protein LBU75_05465 [Desulfovibrio sp.]|nr:hypothetical protein [Desulfovibrio sp.]